MPNQEPIGLMDGIASNSIKLYLDGVPIFALKNFNWKVSHSKKPLYGAGFPKAHGVTRSVHKTYEIDFEIAEVLGNSTFAAAQLLKNTALQAPFQDLTDIRDATIIVMYPGAAIGLSKIFTGCEIVDCDGGFDDTEEASPVGVKCKGFATEMN